MLSRYALFEASSSARRELFAQKMAEKLNATVVPVHAPDEAVDGCDVVVAATNSLPPVTSPEMLERGMHITCVNPAELGNGVFTQCSRIVVNTRYDGPENYIVGRGECGESRFAGHDPLDELGISKRIKRSHRIERIDWRKVPTLAV